MNPTKTTTTVTAKSFDELNDKLTMTVSDYVTEFGSKMRVGMQAIAEAAKVYADALRRHPTTAPGAFKAAYPDVAKNTWEMLEWIGNGDLNPNAYRLPHNVAQKVKRIPIAQQNAIFETGVKGFQVINTVTMHPSVVQLGALSSSQATLLIDADKGKIRSVSEQRKVIEARPDYFRPKRGGNEKYKKQKAKYRICGAVVIINGVEIGREELRNILNEMDGKTPLRK